jgi:outer membrane usher protein
VGVAGGGVVVNVANIGVLNLAGAGSMGTGRSGAQVTFGAQRMSNTFSLGASVSLAGANFRDVAAANGDPVARRQVSASVGLSLGRFGSIGVVFAAIDRGSIPAPIPVYAPPGTFYAQDAHNVQAAGGIYYLQPAQHSHIASASYSVQVGELAIYATSFHDFAGAHGTGMVVGVTIPLGSRCSATASAGSSSGQRYGQVQSMQSASDIGDWGYQAYGTDGSGTHAFGELSYKSPWGQVSAGADRLNRQTTMRGEAQGAFAFADGSLFASNTINDSFAVVDTNGVGNVRVTRENRPMGNTDSAGKLLVPGLTAFDVNRIAIDPADVPMDASVPYVTRTVRPQDKAGVVVSFPVHTSHGALLHLVDQSGKPLPVGTVVTQQEPGAAAVPVGFGGEAYVEDLAPNNRLAVELPTGQRCTVVFDYHAKSGDIPTIGPLACEEKSP